MYLVGYQISYTATTAWWNAAWYVLVYITDAITVCVHVTARHEPFGDYNATEVTGHSLSLEALSKVRELDSSYSTVTPRAGRSTRRRPRNRALRLSKGWEYISAYHPNSSCFRYGALRRCEVLPSDGQGYIHFLQEKFAPLLPKRRVLACYLITYQMSIHGEEQLS